MAWPRNTVPNATAASMGICDRTVCAVAHVLMVTCDKLAACAKDVHTERSEGFVSNAVPAHMVKSKRAVLVVQDANMES